MRVLVRDSSSRLVACPVWGGPRAAGRRDFVLAYGGRRGGGRTRGSRARALARSRALSPLALPRAPTGRVRVPCAVCA